MTVKAARAFRSGGALLALFATHAAARADDRTAPALQTPTPTPTAATDAPSASSCDPGWVVGVYKDVRSGVVRIENAKGIGTGFLVFSPRYVATALHVVALGRKVTVTAADGSQQGATVVVTDALHDLALLELERPIQNAATLAASSRPAPVGTPVVVVGHPFALLTRTDRRFEGLLDWTATEGIVSARSEALLQTDAAVNPGNSGGPVLACDGGVIGIVTAKVGGEGIGFAVPMALVDAMQRQIGKQPTYNGAWSTEGQLYGQGQLDPSYTWLGLGLGATRVAYDRWGTGLRLSVLWAASTPGTSPLSPTYVANGPVLRSTGIRGLGEVDETYRALLGERPFPIYLLLGLGLAATIDRLDQTTLAEMSLTPCTTQGSPSCQSVVGVNTHQTSFTLWPMASAGFLLAGVELSYAFQANVKSLADSEHRLLLGVRF